MQNLDKTEEAIKLGTEASQLKDNKVLKAVFEKVRDQLETRELNASPTEIEVIQDIVRCKQILKGIETAINQIIQDGDYAKANISLIMNKPKKKIINRNSW